MAVVGIGIRAPGGVTDAESYWAVLARARAVCSELPEDRRDRFPGGWDHMVSRACYLERPFDFDARFFGMSPKEARTVDPQHRILLEVVWEAFEDAAIPPGTLGADAGVFVGITAQEHWEWLSGEPNAYWTVGNGHAFAAGRVARELDLRGPAYALDTACSSSLVAVHAACRALTTGDCDVAVAAGVNLALIPRTTFAVGRTGALSPGGESRPFDAAADGYVRGEACAALVLKRLDDAVADRDRVHGIVEGVAINQDGKFATFTSPNGDAQAELVTRLLRRLGLSGRDIGYHEAHGTGTQLGDQVEMAAIVSALRPGGDPRRLFVSSAKATFGHTEAAAGLLGLLRALLSVRHRTVLPQAGFTELNHGIDLAGSGIVVPTRVEQWDGAYATVCSYGMSGTNACAVVSAPPIAAPVVGQVPGFTVSARSEPTLTELADRYHKHLLEIDAEAYPAFAATVTGGRTRLRRTVWVEATTVDEARSGAAALASGAGHPAVRVLADDDPVPWADPPRAVTTAPGYPWQHTAYVAVSSVQLDAGPTHPPSTPSQKSRTAPEGP